MSKLKSRKGIVVIVIVVILFTAIAAVSKENNWLEMIKVSDEYVYPVTPDKTPEKWKAFDSHDEMVAACQIPDEKLKQMSTKGLINTCLKYPLFGDIFLYNSIQGGLNSACNNFNGMHELLKRPDVGEKLLDMYQKIDLDKIKRTDQLPSFRLGFLEMLLSQEDVLLNMKKEQRLELVGLQLPFICLV